MIDNIFFDLTVIFVISTLLLSIAKILKQPVIPVYIITGILLVPIFEIIHVKDFVSSISYFGIVFLLFIAGLELKFDKLKNVSSVASIGGTILVMLLFLIGIAVASLFGLNVISSIFMGLIFAFSSTMVVVKILSDKKQLDSLHGKIAMGLLVIQDIFAIVAFVALTSYGDFSMAKLVELLINIAIVSFIFIVAAKYILPKTFSFVAKFQDLLFLTSITVCLFFALIFGIFISPEALGIGAFLAGLALANLPYDLEIISRISPLKDFFSLLFFTSIGMLLPLEYIFANLSFTITFVLLILVLRPIITFIIIRFFNYMPRVAFLTAITQSQISEFGLILAFFGKATGSLSDELFASIIVIAVLSLTLTSYLTKYENKIYGFVKKYLTFFGGSKTNYDLENLPTKFKKKFILIVGYDRLGYSVLKTLKKKHESIVVVDYNPEVIKKLVEDKIHCIYGDISDSELIGRLKLKNCKLIISTIPEEDSSSLIMQKFKEINNKG
ncbi:cation:proton antiporter, partial [Candidatus Woesearchaeota archaeon]|nr:cation:proton antiporter [Candidatus Woesearchaeota archaeon]